MSRRPEDFVTAPGMSTFAVQTTTEGIGGLEGVTVEEVRRARWLAAEYLSNTTRLLGDARLQLLRAGYGTDHPMCIQLDRLHQQSADLLAVLR